MNKSSEKEKEKDDKKPLLKTSSSVPNLASAGENLNLPKIAKKDNKRRGGVIEDKRIISWRKGSFSNNLEHHLRKIASS